MRFSPCRGQLASLAKFGLGGSLDELRHEISQRPAVEPGVLLLDNPREVLEIQQ